MERCYGGTEGTDDDVEGVGKGDDGPEGREGHIDGQPVAEHLDTPTRTSTDEAEDDDRDDEDREGPAEDLAPLAGGWRYADILEVRRDLLLFEGLDGVDDTPHVSGTDDRELLGPGGEEDRGGEVAVPLIDEHALDRRELAGKLLHHVLHDVGLLQLFKLLLADLLVGEDRADDGCDEFGLVPEVAHTPGALEGRLDIAVAEGVGNPLLLGDAGSAEDLLSRGGARRVAHPLLEGGEGHVGNQEERLALLDDLLDIHVGPGVLLLLVLHPPVVELEADMVWLLALDGEGHLVDALQRDVGSADKQDLLAVLEGKADTGITQFLDGHAVNYTEEERYKQGTLTHSLDLE